MTPTDSAPPPERFHLTALEHAAWSGIRAALRTHLEPLGLDALESPIALIAHDLIDATVQRLHRQVLGQVLVAELGLAPEVDAGALEALFAAETGEHGARNLSRACAAHGLVVTVTCGDAEALLRIAAPVPLSAATSRCDELIGALGLVLELQSGPEGSVLVLRQGASNAGGEVAAHLLDQAEVDAENRRLHEALGHGLLRLSPTGVVRAVSPAMLAMLEIPPAEATPAVLARRLPLAFLDDVVWGQALAAAGVFENYRIRVAVGATGQRSVLFNVSGQRQSDGSIATLWQRVSLAGGAELAEGSILSEARVHNITRNYVPQLVERKAREAVRLGQNRLTDEQRPVAVLFCDIVGFTSYVERHAAVESTIATLNTLLGRVAASVRRHGGSIDKFMGDCVMALFDAAPDALRAAWDMQAHAEDINDLRERAGQQTLRLRIGLHWGEVVIGNVGTAERLDWTAIGDVVNTASRIEKACRPGAVLASAALCAEVERDQAAGFGFGPPFALAVKGKSGELLVRELLSCAPR